MDRISWVRTLWLTKLALVQMRLAVVAVVVVGLTEGITITKIFLSLKCNARQTPGIFFA
jgi:hypothetical protein